MIKKILLSLAAVVILAGLAGLSFHHYHQYQNTKIHKAQVATQTVAQEINAVRQSATAEYTALMGNYGHLQAECQKGVNAYNELTPALKAKLPAPSCQ